MRNTTTVLLLGIVGLYTPLSAEADAWNGSTLRIVTAARPAVKPARSGQPALTAAAALYDDDGNNDETAHAPLADDDAGQGGASVLCDSYFSGAAGCDAGPATAGCDSGPGYCGAARGAGDCGCCEACGWSLFQCNRGCDCPWRLFPQDRLFRARGWVNGGFIYNTDDPASGFNGPYNAVDLANEGMLNQAYLIGELGGIPCDGCFGIGARVDVLYGEDYFLAQSLGFEVGDDATARWNSDEFYGVAVPQAYVEAGNRDISVKVGHFYTPIGYESVMAPENFFYSKSYSYQFAGPFTHWGGLATWKHGCNWEFTAGLVNGWNALDRGKDTVNVIAKAKYTDPCRGWWTSFGVVTGDEFNNPANNPLVQRDYTNRTRYSWLVSIPLSCRCEYVFHHWLGFQEGGGGGAGADFPPMGDWEWYGIDQYLYYTINDCWRAALRFEWFRDDDGMRVGLNRPSNPNNPPFVGNFFSLTAGLNWSPTANIIIRPEVRADWFDGAPGPQPFDDGTSDTQLMIGVDGIVLF